MKASPAIMILMLLPASVFASVMASTSVYRMIHEADIVAVCKILREPFFDIPPAPDEPIKGRHSGSMSLIKIELMDVLIGTEQETKLLVNWEAWSTNSTLRAGETYVIFLWNRKGKSIFIGKPPEGDRRINYAGVEMNHNYERFRSKYGINKITDGKIAWTDGRIMSLDDFVRHIQAERKKRYRPAKPSVYRFYYRRVLNHLSARPYYMTATLFIGIGMLFVFFRRKISGLIARIMIKTKLKTKPLVIATPPIWAAIGSAWILVGVVLFFA